MKIPVQAVVPAQVPLRSKPSNYPSEVLTQATYPEPDLMGRQPGEPWLFFPKNREVAR